ncbi:PucR family transcriptional regulator [Rhodococcus sp. WMMA185]|uniref:PucR family transcriptional regulator n=1 Tax=Rhodococcus sp. WMMA185 TaxID=679318 RepID=UPI000878AA48|nr:helix-turn-helix domain-containing protein [Rhodococcus sp. WMMA185]
MNSPDEQSTPGPRPRLARAPAPAETEVLDIVAGVARRLDSQQAEITHAMSALLAREIDELNENPELFELMEASVHSNISTIIHVLANDIPVEHLQPPTAAVEYVLRLAQRDVSSHAVARAYHMGQDDLMKICYDEVHALELSAPLTLAVLKHLSDVVFSYIDWITLYVFEAHEQERQRWIGAQGNVHSSTIHGLLEDTGSDPGQFEAETQYRLEQNHVAIIAWSTTRDDSASLNSLYRYVRDVAAHLTTDSAPIVTAIDRNTIWAWMPFGSRRPAIDSATLPTDTNVRAAIGLPAHGIAGFRRSHEQARAAYSVANVPNTPARPIVSFGDRGVAVVSLLSENLESTRAWVWEVLGPLAENTDQAATLRTTLSTYFANGESHLHTAQQMNLHRNTVKYRITKALGEPGTGIAGHSKLDLALALQVCEFLGPTVLR